MTRLEVDRAVQEGRNFQFAGLPAQAEARFRQALAADPDHLDALQAMAEFAMSLQRHEVAVPLLQRALALGAAESIDFALLAQALHFGGRPAEAIEVYRTALRLDPTQAAIWSNLGVALLLSRRPAEALGPCQEAVRLEPRSAKFHYNVGHSLQVLERLEEAAASYRQAVALKADYADALNNLGGALYGLRQMEEAIAAFREAARLRPQDAATWSNLGSALHSHDLVDEAVVVYRHALTLDPTAAATLNNLANAWKDLGRMEEAMECYRQAVTLCPEVAEVHSNWLYSLHFLPGVDAASLLREHRVWNERHGAPPRLLRPALAPDRSPNRRLRIGYVSADFYHHVAGCNLLPLFRAHDHAAFEIYCYSNTVKEDGVTEELRARSDHWRSIIGLSDDAAADLIRKDGIDVLVDLGLHTRRNRLLTFARKPTPVQVTYLGYCSTSGLETMDFRLSDPYLDPPETDLFVYSEETIRLPRCYWCYEPGAEEVPAAAGPPPSQACGFITFGCLNNFAKVSKAALDLWSEILRALPNSQLALHAPEGSSWQRVGDLFAQAGVDPARIRLHGRLPRAAYMELWGRVDIGLDPFPYGGGISTCDGLWMGAPIVTLSGKTAVGRAGRTILSNIGLPELVAFDERQYVEIALGLANDPDRLAALRAGLRERMEKSPLRDAAGFARDVEDAYRTMWRKWLARSE